MFALPGIQALQLHRPLLSAQATAAKMIDTLRSRPEAKDYANAVEYPEGKEKQQLGATAQQQKRKAGPLHHLTPDICAICHTRISPAVDSALGLPLPNASADADPLHLQAHSATEASESRIHMPTRAGCEAGCVYCYFCIAGAITAEAKRVEEAEQYGRDAGDGWPCLRCGQGIWSCSRIVVSTPQDEADEGYGSG